MHDHKTTAKKEIEKKQKPEFMTSIMDVGMER
jgi:hypothetical protein